MPVINPGVYTHWKGGHYLVLMVGVFASKDDDGHEAKPVVIYTPLDAERAGRVHVRFVDEFCAPVRWPDGKARSRFHPGRVDF